MRGVIYARYSSDNQREESIEGQIRENTAYAKKNGIDIVGTYIDRAFSAKTDNRPEFQRMIKDSAKKNFDVVIVWKLDRFSRNRYDSAKYKAMLKKNDVKVISATEAISEGAEGIILESVLEGMAEYYSADLAEKVSRGMTENALKCRFNGGTIPFGYMIDEEQHYQIDSDKAPLIVEMFRRYAGGESITDIIEELNARGIRTSKGNRFNKNSLARIFANRRYIGEYAYKDVVIPDSIPAIVSKDIFERVAIRMKQNRHATGKSKAPEKYILTTKLFCGTCQSMFVGDSANKANGAIYRYYKCAGAKRHKCDRKALRKEWIEDIIIQKITSWLNNDKLISDMADDVMTLLNEDDGMILALETQLKEVRSSIDNIMKAIEKGVVTRSTKTRLEELEVEEEKLTYNIKAEEAKKPKITKEFIIFTLNKFRNLDLRVEKNKERLIDGLVKAILVYDDYIKVFLTFDDKPINIPTSDEIEYMANSSDIALAGSPHKKASLLGRLFCFNQLRISSKVWLIIKLHYSQTRRPLQSKPVRVYYSQTGYVLIQVANPFESLIKLHYSQTPERSCVSRKRFESLIKLHYSQTIVKDFAQIAQFESLIKLHYSQTQSLGMKQRTLFKSLIKLHYSQTHRSILVNRKKFKSLIKLHYSQTQSLQI